MEGILSSRCGCTPKIPIENIPDDSCQRLPLAPRKRLKQSVLAFFQIDLGSVQVTLQGNDTARCINVKPPPMSPHIRLAGGAVLSTAAPEQMLPQELVRVSERSYNAVYENSDNRS